MRKIINQAMLAVLAAFSILMLAGISNAQQPDWARNGRYTRGSVDKIIKRVENRTDRFVKQFDKALDRSSLDGSRREDNLNQSAKDLEHATDQLRSEFNKHRNWWETRDNVQNCLSIAANINTAMLNHRFNRGTENNWRNVRQELNTLAQVYNLPPMGEYR
ncbi:MAG: hypothetical protein ACR2GD_04485 [Pyrinomonadaceae bacterium]